MLSGCSWVSGHRLELSQSTKGDIWKKPDSPPSIYQSLAKGGASCPPPLSMMGLCLSWVCADHIQSLWLRKCNCPAVSRKHCSVQSPTTSGSNSLLSPSPQWVQPFREECDIDVPFGAEHFLVSYSPWQVSGLWVNHLFQKKSFPDESWEMPIHWHSEKSWAVEHYSLLVG